MAFRRGVLEVDELQRADPTPIGAPPAIPEVTRVIGRASVVLLSSHFERYVYAINEEAIQLVNDTGIKGLELSEEMRLLHSQPIVDGLIATSWERRGKQLTTLIKEEAWLWAQVGSGLLDHDRLIEWMKAPTPKNLMRYFRYWGIKDIFEAITRASHTKSELWLRIDELVRKRNNIAHGDLTTEATHADIVSYRDATTRFSERVDRKFGAVVGRLIGHQAAW